MKLPRVVRIEFLFACLFCLEECLRFEGRMDTLLRLGSKFRKYLLLGCAVHCDGNHSTLSGSTGCRSKRRTCSIRNGFRRTGKCCKALGRFLRASWGSAVMIAIA
jgi:hypothetical protein